MKTINLDLPVAKLVEQYAELKPILKDLGFTEIVNPVALSTVGNIVSLKKGAQIKTIDLKSIVKRLEDEGFEVVDPAKHEEKEE